MLVSRIAFFLWFINSALFAQSLSQVELSADGNVQTSAMAEAMSLVESITSEIKVVKQKVEEKKIMSAIEEVRAEIEEVKELAKASTTKLIPRAPWSLTNADDNKQIFQVL